MAPVPSPQDWAEGLWASADFGDRRLTRRAVRIAATLAAAPTDSIPQACGKWAETKATYRFIDNERVTPRAIFAPVRRKTAEASADLETLLAIQDTTAMVFPNAYQATGLGPVNGTKAQGLFVHSTLALRESGIALGVLDQHVWARPAAKPKTRGRQRKNARGEKESRRWIAAVRVAHEAVARQLVPDRRPRLIHVGDRESDIYDLLETIVELGDGAVIRCTHDRRIETADGRKGRAHQEIEPAWPLGSLAINVPRKRNEPARLPTLELRAQRQTLLPPASRKDRGTPLDLTLLEVWEPDPPEGAKRLHWRLWPTEPVSDLDQASRVVSI